MQNQIFFRIFPYFFIFFFIFFEFVPIYFLEEELIKPFISMTIIYCWICNDPQRFRPLWLLIFGIFCDFLQSEIVGISSLFFLVIGHIQRKANQILISNDFKETWIKFVILIFLYFILIYFINLLFADVSLIFKNILICYIFTVSLFPFFFLVVDKLSFKFRRFDDQ